MTALQPSFIGNYSLEEVTLLREKELLGNGFQPFTASFQTGGYIDLNWPEFTSDSKKLLAFQLLQFLSPQHMLKSLVIHLSL